MKVFANYRSGGYSGGVILVAANSAEEAHKAFHENEYLKWMWNDINWENPPYVEDLYYKPDGWKEMPMLEAHVDKPQVLTEAGHSE